MKSPMEVFEIAVEFNGQARVICLDRVCGDDAGLRAEVESLLAAHDAAGTFLGDPTHDVEALVPKTGSTTRTRRHAPAAEASGEIIGRYKLLENIGEGGFGTVWMAEQKEPVKRRVALKIIKLGMDTKQVIARFEAERQALALMDHPNIAKVLDAGATEAGRPFFVMELIKGVPILEYCDTEKLDTDARLDLFTKVCNAIQHAHQKGIIHRDIKPSNVMITLHDGVPVPKVIDFGIAKATNQELTAKTLFTQHRQMIGTPAYMSPEQAEMSGLDIDTRSDIYSLGVLLYELLTGTTPFNSEELMSKGFAEMMRIIREIEPHKPSTRLSTLGDSVTRTAQQRRVDVKELGGILRGDLDWIVMRCLEKDRARRYDTANGLALDIQRHLNDEPVAAGPPSTTYKFHKFVKRNRGGVIAASIVTAVLVLGIVGTTGGLLWALAAERAAQRESARATEVKRLINEMLESVSPWISKGADTTLLKRIVDDTARRLTAGEVTDELIAADLHALIGRVYFQLNLRAEAQKHTSVAFEIRLDGLGERNRATLQSGFDQLILRKRQSRAPQQKTLLVQAMRQNWELRKEVLGAEDPDTLASQMELATISTGQDWQAQADRILEVLEARKRVLVPAHYATLRTMAELAATYQRLGQTDKAESILLEALEVSGEMNPRTLDLLGYTARLYEHLGRFEEAVPYRLKSLESSLGELGETHPFTLLYQTKLAALYVMMGQDDDAIREFEIDVENRRRFNGLEEPGTWFAVRNLGACYEKVGRPEDALVGYRELVDFLPPDPRTVEEMQAAFSMAWLLTRDFESLRDAERAVEFSKRALELIKVSGRHGVYQYFSTGIYEYLALRALAEYQAGNLAGAIAIQKQAITRIPRLADQTVRGSYEANLRDYEAALAAQNAPPDEPTGH